MDSEDRIVSVVQDTFTPSKIAVQLTVENGKQSFTETLRCTRGEAEGVRDTLIAYLAETEPEASAHEECRAEMHSWDYFTSQQVDSYWMRCHLLGPHEEHENSETGARWKTEQENTR